MLTFRLKLAFALAVLLASLVIGELASFALVKYVLQKNQPNFFAHDFDDLARQLPEDAIQSYAKVFYDRELGWDFHANVDRSGMINTAGKAWSLKTDGKGARSNPYPAEGEGLISLYGDSLTFSDEVNDDQSWQYYLSILTKSRVADFAVGAYATDQALYKLMRQLRDGRRSEVVVLGIYAENIKRIMSAYRLFYVPTDGHVLGFKPIYAIENGKYQWILPKLEKPTDRASIAEAIEWAKRYDHFYRINRMMPTGRFPYLKSLFDFVAYVYTIRAFGQEQLAPFGGDTDAMWRYPVARDRMWALIDVFMRLSREYDFHPVVVFIPEPQDVRAVAEGGAQPEYRRFAHELRRAYAVDGLRVVDVLDSSIDYPRYNLVPFGAHPSAYGNKVIATAVFEAIRDLPPIRQRLDNAPKSPDTGSAASGIQPQPGVAPILAAEERLPVCGAVLAQYSGRELAKLATPEHAVARVEGDDLILDADNDDPILFLPRLTGTVERARFDLDEPGATYAELFVITDRTGYTAQPYRIYVQAGRAALDFAVGEREPLRLRFDPGAIPGIYRLRRVTFLAECDG